MELRGDIKCPCKSKADDCGFMIQCDKCRGWFHGKCVEVDSKRAETILSFHCSDCEVVYGHSIYREANRKSTRDKNNICYDEIRGVPTDELKYTKLLCTKRFVQHDFPEITGSELRVEYIAERGMRCPIIVRDPEGLDMKMPPNTITVDDIANSCGRDKVVDVLEVSTQSERMMTLDQWATYFALPQKERPRILNVITLEVSDSSIGKEIVRPKLVRDIDWIDHVWPRELKEEANYPRVQLYCLMSVKDCYTDFHIDFGGSSVYYHILSGSKVFYFIEPSPGNLKKYEAWTSSPDQATTYFADLVKDCYQVNLVAGNTMIIPTGWIHAVYTPADSIVIGGNFLHGFNIGTQFDIYDIEKRTHVPPKFRFPYFEMMNWYAARYYLIKIRENPSSVHNFELKGLLALCLYLQRIAFKLTDIGGVTDKEERKEIKRNIPKTLKNVQKLIRKLYDKVKEERKVRKTLITRDDEEGEEEGKQKVAGLEKRQEEKGTEGDSENESEEDDEVEDKEAAAEKEILGRAIFFKVSKFSHGNLLPEPNNALPKITLKMNQEEIDPALLSDDWDENLTEMEFFDSEPEDIIPEEEEDSDYDEEFATKPIQRKRNVSSTEDQNFIPKKKKAVSEPSPEVLIPFKNHSIPIEDRKPTITAADLPKPEIKQYIPPKPVVKKNPPGKHGKVFSKLMKMSRR